MEKDNETLEAKLRNQLSPIYNLADMILIMNQHPEKEAELKSIVLAEATKVVENKQRIEFLLSGIEAKTTNKPDVLRTAFDAGKERTFEHFDDWLLNK